jgi:indole-3-glycerol phosphate synthase
VNAGSRTHTVAAKRSASRGRGGAGGSAGAQTYLERIVPAVRRRLEARRTRLPLTELAAMSAPGPRASFAGALRARGLSLIAEVKRASPSKGPIRPALDVAEVVQAYETAGARAVSVLTEEDFFRGSPADLRTAVAHTELPILRKDFIVDAYQIHESRVLGASAVLLIATLLDDRALRRLAGLAIDLGMDVLLEVHDATEMARALVIDKAIIGVNNRDLRTFAVSLETTERLAGLVPPGRLLVSESGIDSRDDVEWLGSLGVDGVLVGERILRDADPGRTIRALLDPVPRVMERPFCQAQRKEAG